MNVITLTCNHCGAPLDVPEGVNFFNCRFCSSRLAIERSASAVYTRVLEGLEQKTNEISQDLQTIKAQNEIERLDREWQVERDQLLIHRKDGRTAEPSVAGTIGSSLMLALIGLVWFIGSTSMSRGGMNHGISSLFPILGLGLMGFSLVALIRGLQKARDFDFQRSTYEARRRQLIDELRRPQE
jgi:hypothetical protein